MPFEDKRAFELSLRAYDSIKNEKKGVIIGDFGDCYSVSFHSRDPKRKMHLADEIGAVNERLDQIQSFAGSHVTFLEGNHEDRLRRYVWDKAPELDGLTTIRGAYNLDKRGWQHVPYREYVRIGRVGYVHDLDRSGVYATRQTLMDFGGNIVFGHSHRGGIAYQGEIKGVSHFGMNVGWLGDLTQVDYKHRAKAERDWQLGFGIVDYTDDLQYAWATFIPIVDYHCSLRGTLLRG